MGISSIRFSYSPIHFLCIYRYLALSIFVIFVKQYEMAACILHVNVSQNVLCFNFILLFFVWNSLSFISIPKRNENIIWIEDKIEPQHVMYNWMGAVKWNLYRDLMLFDNCLRDVPFFICTSCPPPSPPPPISAVLIGGQIFSSRPTKFGPFWQFFKGEDFDSSRLPNGARSG